MKLKTGMLYVITGGSGSGKSAYAEDKLCSLTSEHRVYIATMFSFDTESDMRIQRHRKMRRDKGFDTIECYTNLASVVVPKDSCVLLECMSNLVANEMYQENGAKENTCEVILRGVESLLMQARHVVIVTNEIFSHTNQYDQETRKYQEYLGYINQELGHVASEVVEVVYGIPIKLKEGKE